MQCSGGVRTSRVFTEWSRGVGAVISWWLRGAVVVVARCCNGGFMVVRCPLFCAGKFSHFCFCFCASDISKSNTK